MNNIVVVCATAGSKDAFNKKPLGKWIAGYSGSLEVILFENNLRPLTEVYNQAIESLKNRLVYVIFAHDDVYIDDLFLQEKMRSTLKKFDMIGVVGAKYLRSKMTMWCLNCCKPDELELQKTNLVGAIRQGLPDGGVRIDTFGETNVPVVAVDGCFMAMKSSLFSKGITFDEAFSFHHYDIDFSFALKRLGCSVGVADISITHMSPGNISNEWMGSAVVFLKKWRHIMGD